MPDPGPRRRGRPRAQPEPAVATEAPLHSLDRGLALLGTLAAADGLTLTEAAARGALPLSTAHRMLLTLSHRGLVEFDPALQRWSIGVETFRIGSAFLRRRKLVDRALPAMQALMADTGETANLAVAEEDGVVFVSQVESHETIRAFFRPGTRALFHASGIGKAILAHRHPAQVAATLKRAGLPRFTPHTCTTIEALAENLRRIRAEGHAVDDEERNLGMRCVAAAIFDEAGAAIAGLSISGPTVRVTPERVAEIGAQVRAAAAQVTHAIAGRVRGD